MHRLFTVNNFGEKLISVMTFLSHSESLYELKLRKYQTIQQVSIISSFA